MPEGIYYIGEDADPKEREDLLGRELKDSLVRV
jgi:hypothetical protein